MLGFLSLPLHWIFFMSASSTGAFSELGFCCAWPPPHEGWADFVSARLDLRNGTVDIGGVCHFLSLVLLQQKFEATDRPVLGLSVTAQLYLASKGKYILEAWGPAEPKDAKRKTQFWLFFLYVFLLPRACSMKNGLARRAVCFTWGSYSGPWTFLCFISMGFFLSLSFSHHYFRLLFPILTT